MRSLLLAGSLFLASAAWAQGEPVPESSDGPDPATLEAPEDDRPTADAEQVVKLNDGSELRGRVAGIANGVLTLDTTLGPIQIPMDKVQSIEVLDKLPEAAPTPVASTAETSAPVPPAPPTLRGSPHERHTGFNFAWNTGLQIPFGQAYGRFLPGPAQKFDIGGRVTPDFAIETGFAFASGDVDEPDSSQAVWIHLLTLDARYFLTGSGRWEPNLLAGIALASGVNWESEEFELGYSGNSYHLGFGFRMHQNHRYYLNLDVRYVYTAINRASIGDLGFAANLEGNLLQVMVGIGKQH